MRGVVFFQLHRCTIDNAHFSLDPSKRDQIQLRGIVHADNRQLLLLLLLALFVVESAIAESFLFELHIVKQCNMTNEVTYD